MKQSLVVVVVVVVAVGESTSSGTGCLHQVLEVTGGEVRTCLTVLFPLNPFCTDCAFPIESILH